MTDREIFRKNLSNLMNETRTKQIDLAKYAEVSYQTVSSWITGRGYPRAEAMAKICQFFGVKQSVLTESNEQKTKEEALVYAYRYLSEEGREKLIERVNELLKLYPKGDKKHEKK